MDSNMIRISSTKQKGQALPLGVAFLMSSILFVLVLFNTGQTASEKSRLANTADAAVYSGLIWQARALNFQAYTNRAMVANQVSIGQMVSFSSWARYASILIRNVDYIANFIWVMKPFTSIANQIMGQVDNVVVNITEALIPVVDGVNGVLSNAQQAVYLASFAATPAIVQEVVEKNDERYNVNSAYAVIGMGENAMAWNNFAEQYDDRDALLRKADVVNRSKDEFTNARNIGQRQLLPGSPSKITIFPMRFWIKKEGRSNLIAEEGNSGDIEWEWKGKDTLSLHSETYRCSVRRGCGWRSHVELPMGWGSRYVNGDFECEEDDEGREICPEYMNENRWAEDLADLESEELDADYNGIRAYYDLSDLSEENKDPRLVLRIEVDLPEDEVRTASKIENLGSDSVPNEETGNGIGIGVFGTEDRMAGEGIASIASGEVFFHPPDDYNPSRRRGRYEIANLFNPYWEVRLTKTPIERRFMAWALRDSDLLTEGASGIAEGVAIFISEREEELSRLQHLQEDLQNQLDSTVDDVERAQIQSQLNAVNIEIADLESQNYDVNNLTQNLQQNLSQGVSSAANTQVAQYEQELEQYAQQQSEEFTDQFQDEIVGQVTDSLQEALEGAVEDAVESAISSFFGG